MEMNIFDALREGHTFNVTSKGYFDSYTHNIYNNKMDQRFQEMFDNGNGGELHSKAEAVHSSSMLAYNFFHWISQSTPFVFNDVKYTDVFFEVRMRTLKCKGTPANIDVVLKGVGLNDGQNYLLFIESKFTEYFKRNKFELSNSYTNSRNWYSHNGGANNINWRFIITQTSSLCNNNKCYADGLKQTITHLFGIESLNDQSALNWFNKQNGQLKLSNPMPNIIFANCVFAPDKQKFELEYSRYEDYQGLFNDFIGIINNVNASGNGISIVPQWYSYSDLWQQMRIQIPDLDLVKYLEERYLQFGYKD